jgi:hypothetical protein
MTCKVERENGALKAMTFHCDAEGCDVVANDEHIEKSGGLRYMGWWATGGKHYCPDHYGEGEKIGQR